VGSDPGTVAKRLKLIHLGRSTWQPAASWRALRTRPCCAASIMQRWTCKSMAR